MSGLGKNKSSSKRCSKIVDDMGNVYENSEAAEFLNSHYVEVGPKLAKNHTESWDKGKCKIQVNSTFHFTWVPEKMVRELVNNICIAKSSALNFM